jgi:hypothetical protein
MKTTLYYINNAFVFYSGMGYRSKIDDKLCSTMKANACDIFIILSEICLRLKFET